MFNKETESLLHKSLPAVPRLVCARSLALDIDELVKDALPGLKPAVVFDQRTAEMLGEQVLRALKPLGAAGILLEGLPEADESRVELIRHEARDHGALVAVGSGTIADLCKYASFLDGKPYAVFPTAASMNGYLSANASITVDGYKKTMAAHMPKAVFCDLSVIAAAPVRLNKSGLGDSLARPTAQADWLLSHLLLGTDYAEIPFDLLKPYESELFEHARGIARGDEASIELLLKVLLLSGAGMTIAGGSYPASQGEHMIAHAMHMMKGEHPQTFHGEEIGVTSLAMARRQEALLGIEPELLSDAFHPTRVAELYGEHVAHESQAVFAQKQEVIKKSLNPNVFKRWPEVASKIEKIMLPPARIEAILKQAEAPFAHQQLGWSDRAYMDASSTARFLRERFTFLDIC